MTIYDTDYVSEETPAVKDSVAESQVAVAQEEIQEPVQDALPQEASQAEEQVSDKELNFRALRDKLERIEREREEERREFDYLRGQVAAQKIPPQAQKSSLEGVEDDDFLTVGKYKKSLQELQQMHSQEIESMRLQNEEDRLRTRYSDYDEVVNKYVIPQLQKDHDFARGLNAAQNKATFAYNYGKGLMLAQIREEIARPEPDQSSRKAERIVENSRKPGTLSNARGGQPQISKADYYASLPDDKFMEMVEKNLSEV